MDDHDEIRLFQEQQKVASEKTKLVFNRIVETIKKLQNVSRAMQWISKLQ